MPAASSARQKYLTYRTESLRRRTLLPCATDSCTAASFDHLSSMPHGVPSPWCLSHGPGVLQKDLQCGVHGPVLQSKCNDWCLIPAQDDRECSQGPLLGVEAHNRALHDRQKAPCGEEVKAQVH